MNPRKMKHRTVITALDQSNLSIQVFSSRKKAFAYYAEAFTISYSSFCRKVLYPFDLIVFNPSTGNRTITFRSHGLR